jgi:DNA topoisomerase-1
MTLRVTPVSAAAAMAADPSGPAGANDAAGPAGEGPLAAPKPLPGGLLYVDGRMPGIGRVRRGKRFRYRHPDGRWLDDAAQIERIDRLAIPPAYERVWICPLDNGHLQATGFDARGRKQYRYHAQWRALRDEDKFERLEAFGAALPRIRARIARDLASGGRGRAPGRAQVLATLVRLLDTTYMRIGNEEYAASNGSYGLTTLRRPHAGVRGDTLRLRFRGKSGVEHAVELDDPRVAAVVRRCQQLPGQELFQYQDDEGGAHAVGSSEVNDYIAEAAGERFTAKDFRTWHGTVQALELTRLGCACGVDATARDAFSAKKVLAEVARQLGNTPAVCKKSYVHPAVLDLGETLAGKDGSGLADIWDRIAGRGGQRKRLHAAEHRLLGFLHEHRRAQARDARRRSEKVRGAPAPARKKAGTAARAAAGH